MNGVGIREDVKRRFPVAMLVRGAELRDAERRRIGKRAAEVGWGRAGHNRRLQRLQNPVRIIAKQGPGELRMIRPWLGAPGSREKAWQFRGGLPA